MVAVVTWAGLPIALNIVLGEVDPFTVTWIRYLFAATAWGGMLVVRKNLPNVRKLKKADLALLGIATLGLSANHILYLSGLTYISPGTAQLVFQVSPIFMTAGGLILFKESFAPSQWLGLVLLLGGFALFFSDRLGAFFEGGGAQTIGVALIVCSAFTWTCYALSQKQLLNALPSTNIMWILYCGGTLIYSPLSHPAQLLELTPLVYALLAFACVNTLVAYGCISEALHHIEASRAGALIAINPLFTLILVSALSRLWPAFVAPEGLNPIRIGGAIVTVLGAALVALSR